LETTISQEFDERGSVASLHGFLLQRSLPNVAPAGCRRACVSYRNAHRIAHGSGVRRHRPEAAPATIATSLLSQALILAVISGRKILPCPAVGLGNPPEQGRQPDSTGFR